MLSLLTVRPSLCFNTFTFWEGLRLHTYQSTSIPPRGFNTFTFWEGLRPYGAKGTMVRNDMFQHLYLLGRSATVCTKSSTGSLGYCFNTFTFWEGLRLQACVVTQKHTAEFQHLYLLGRSATKPSSTFTSHTSSFNTFTFWEGLRLDHRYGRWVILQTGCFNTFTFWEGLRRLLLELPTTALGQNDQVSTPLPSGKVCDLTGLRLTTHS